MTDIVRLILDILKGLSPCKIVPQWCQGLYFVCGKYRGSVGPGLKLVIPYLCEVTAVSVVPRNEQTPRQTVTLRDGRTLTFVASLTMHVEDARAAWCEVEKWSETVVEEASGVLAEMLAETDPDRFDPARGKRARLREEIREEVDGLCRRYGVRVTAVRFTDFVIGARTVRVLLDRTAPPMGNGSLLG